MHGFVEFAAFHGDAVFGSFELCLQIAESLRGSELGVALNGDLDGCGQGFAEFVLGFLVGTGLKLFTAVWMITIIIAAI